MVDFDRLLPKSLSGDIAESMLCIPLQLCSRGSRMRPEVSPLPSANEYWLLFTIALDNVHADGIPIHSVNNRTQLLVPLLREPGCIRNLRRYDGNFLNINL